MPARKPRPTDEKPQIEKFREMARELGCDESEEAFDAILRKIATAKPTLKSAKSPPKQK